MKARKTLKYSELYVAFLACSEDTFLTARRLAA